jgi:hypothetical protein
MLLLVPRAFKQRRMPVCAGVIGRASHHCVCCFGLHCRVFGFWLALTFSTALQAAAFGLLIARFDWVAEVQRAAAMLRAAHQARESNS